MFCSIQAVTFLQIRLKIRSDRWSVSNALVNLDCFGAMLPLAAEASFPLFTITIYHGRCDVKTLPVFGRSSVHEHQKDPARIPCVMFEVHGIKILHSSPR
jgi:hypothetical protein